MSDEAERGSLDTGPSVERERRRRIVAIRFSALAALGGIAAAAVVTAFGGSGFDPATPVADAENGVGFAAAGVPFTIAGSAGRALHPGGSAVPIDLTFTNPSARAITVASVAVRISGTSAARCAAANFRVARQPALAVSVPARSSVSLSGLGISRARWPHLRMLDAGRQDACKHATVHLAFSGTAGR
jgi:hypothetical protein